MTKVIDSTSFTCATCRTVAGGSVVRTHSCPSFRLYLPANWQVKVEIQVATPVVSFYCSENCMVNEGRAASRR